MSFSTVQNGTNVDIMVKNKVGSVIIYFRFLHYGNKGVSELRIQNCIGMIKNNFLKDRPIAFWLTYVVMKMQFFSNAKDRTPLLCHFNVIYELVCHECSGHYDGKTEKRFHERTCEDAWADKDRCD